MTTRTFRINVVAAGTLPDWVPVTVGLSALVPMTNTLDNVASTGVYTPAGNFSIGDYSGGRYNPDFSTWGGMVVHGGGHAGTNNNGVFVADLTTCSWSQVGAPTDLQALGKYATYTGSAVYDSSYDYFIRRGPLSTGWPTLAEANDPAKYQYADWDNPQLNPREVVPGVPGSAHTYDSMFILPASLGGGSKGSLIRVVSFAVGTKTSSATGHSHKFDFATNTWSRITATGYAMPGAAGVAFDQNTRRAWVVYTQNDATPNQGYLDVSNPASATWGGVTGSSVVNNDGYIDNVTACWHAAKSIAIHATSINAYSGITRFYWFSTTANQGTRREVTWTGGSTVPAHFNTGAGTLCDIPELGKVFFYSAFDPDAYYLFTVPADPTQPWTSQRFTISGAQPSALSPAFRPTMYHRMDYSAKLKSVLWVTSQLGNPNVFGGRVLAIRVVP